MEPITVEAVVRHCLDNPDRLSVPQLLAQFPAYRAELGPLLELHQRLTLALRLPLAPGLRRALNQRLLEMLAARQSFKAE